MRAEPATFAAFSIVVPAGPHCSWANPTIHIGQLPLSSQLPTLRALKPPRPRRRQNPCPEKPTAVTPSGVNSAVMGTPPAGRTHQRAAAAHLQGTSWLWRWLFPWNACCHTALEHSTCLGERGQCLPPPPPPLPWALALHLFPELELHEDKGSACAWGGIDRLSGLHSIRGFRELGCCQRDVSGVSLVLAQWDTGGLGRCWEGGLVSHARKAQFCSSSSNLLWNVSKRLISQYFQKVIK